MGADKMATNDNRVILIQDPKIFYINVNDSPEFLVGVSGNLRVLNIIKYNNQIMNCQLTDDPYFNIINILIPYIQETLKNHNSFMEYEDEQANSDSHFLIGHKGKIFIVSSNYCITETYENFGVIGCGEEIAIGALEVLTRTEPYHTNIIDVTLKIVSKHIFGVSNTFDCLTLEPQGLNRMKK